MWKCSIVKKKTKVNLQRYGELAFGIPNSMCEIYHVIVLPFVFFFSIILFQLARQLIW